MEKQFKSTYFIYPIKFINNSEPVVINEMKGILQNGWCTSLDKPEILIPECVYYSEADIESIGMTKACESAMYGTGADACVVYRIPNSYLGLEQDSQFDMSPVMYQLVKTPENANDPLFKSNDRFYSIMRNFIDGVYAQKICGYIENTGYSEVCNCYGILSDEQRKKIKDKVSNEFDKYSKMLEYDEKVRQKFPITSAMTQEEMKQTEDFYLGENSPYNVIKKHYQQPPHRHLITDNEFIQMLQRNRDYLKSTNKMWQPDTSRQM